MEEALVSSHSPQSFFFLGFPIPPLSFCGRLYPCLPISLYPRLTSQPGELPIFSFSSYEFPGVSGPTEHIWPPWLVVLVLFLLIPLSRYRWIKLWYCISYNQTSGPSKCYPLHLWGSVTWNWVKWQELAGLTSLLPFTVQYFWCDMTSRL